VTACEQKHPCKDCSYCQWCSDDRCRLCLGTGCAKKKLSLQEQIELFEKLNRDPVKPSGVGTP